MGRIKLILVFAVVVAAIIAGSQIIPPELANFQFEDDLHDVASLSGARIGLLSATTEDSLRSSVISRAKEHDIELSPSQVTVEYSRSSGGANVYLEAHYTVPVNLLGYTFELKFDPSLA